MIKIKTSEELIIFGKTELLKVVLLCSYILLLFLLFCIKFFIIFCEFYKNLV